MGRALASLVVHLFWLCSCNLCIWPIMSHLLVKKGLQLRPCMIGAPSGTSEWDLWMNLPGKGVPEVTSFIMDAMAILSTLALSLRGGLVACSLAIGEGGRG